MTTLSAEVAEAVRLRDAARRDGEFTVVKHPFVGTAVFAPHGVGPVAEFLQAASRHVDLIERLHARVRELIEGKDYGPFERQINDLQMQNANCVKENLRLRAELEQARADGERYRKLRSLCDYDGPIGGWPNPGTPVASVIGLTSGGCRYPMSVTGDDLDNAIDALKP